jgi:hypothetical protein
LLHQDARDVGNAAERKIGRQFERDLDRMGGGQRPIGVTPQRSGTSISARMASSGGWPGPGVTISVRQIAEPTKST